MAEYEAEIGTIIMDGLATFKAPHDPVQNPRAYAVTVGQYVEAIVDARITKPALLRALKYIRASRTSPFWPTIAEVVEDGHASQKVLDFAAQAPAIPMNRTPPRLEYTPTPAERENVGRLLAAMRRIQEAGGTLPPLEDLKREVELAPI